jgi:hypothetical protein
VIADNPGEAVRLLGPNTFWRAEAAGAVRIRLTSRVAGKVRVYWRGTPPLVASTRPSEYARWRETWWDAARSVEASFPSGDKQWVTVKLAGAPGYEGGLTGLALDVPDGVAVFEVTLGSRSAARPGRS